MVEVDNIVVACVEHFKKIQEKIKLSENEWTVISAIVGIFNEQNIQILSMGTGSKCIGKSFLSSNGDILNDSHAEVIGRRAFIKYLYHQIISFNLTHNSEVVYYNGSTYCIKDTVKFHFVTSMLPCGDASILPKLNICHSNLNIGVENLKNEEMVGLSTKEELKKRKLGNCDLNLEAKKVKTIHEDNCLVTENGEPSDIHRTGAKCLLDSAIQDPHKPGVYYHNTRAVRIKPGRGDPTLSLSCSDKIARWNAVGWQGALLSLLIKTPIFMESIICGGNCPFSKESFDRAVNERIQKKPFIPIYQSTVPFTHLKADVKKPTPLSVIWSKTPGAKLEISVNGRKQGVTKKNINKKQARTSICKKELFLLFREAIATHPEKAAFWEDLNYENEFVPNEKIPYGDIKMLSIDYQKRWAYFKEHCFKVWSKKPRHLLNFTTEDH